MVTIRDRHLLVPVFTSLRSVRCLQLGEQHADDVQKQEKVDLPNTNNFI